MNHIKIYEEFESEYINPFPYQDNYLRIHKIKQGPNKGKIHFIFIIPTEYDTVKHIKKDEENKYSMVLGCIKILDTEYENNPQIRNIELGPVRFRKVAPNTMESVFIEFLISMGYETEDKAGNMYSAARFGEFSELLKDLKDTFSDELGKVAETAKNLGEVMDNLKILRNEIFETLKNHFEDWQLQRSIKSYNL